jgi:site-specific DNA-cytosine methylase
MKTVRRMRVVSLCTGIGGIDLAAESTGLVEIVGQVEIDPFCNRVLEKHWPHVKRLRDIREVVGDEFGEPGTIDLVVAGFPCQPTSTAGKRRGAADARWLWPEVDRIIRRIRPAWLCLENVAGLISLGLDTVFDDLDAAGYEAWPVVFPAAAVGAPHERERVFIVWHRADKLAVAHAVGERRGGIADAARWHDGDGDAARRQEGASGAEQSGELVGPLDDAARRIYTRIRISKGAQDTWEKVKDGTLAGASIGASDVVWQNQRIAGEDVPVATRYDLVELSLVDLPSNPDALGVTFVRDGVPDGALLDDLESQEAAGIADDSGQARSAAAADTSDAPAADNGPPSTTFTERDGSLSDEDPALLIAADALARGQSDLSALVAGSGSAPLTEPTAKARRLAALGAPGYTARADRATESPAPGEGTTGYGVDQPLDIDGDHEEPDDYVTIQSGPTAGAVFAPSPAESVAHMAHSHHHTGQYDDPSNHRESSPHQHLDGTSHTHDHVMDHDHGGHDGVPNGHAHPHLHVPDHGHYYRVADGAPLDKRLVAGEQVRTHEYVSLAAFRAAGAVEGQPMTAEQYRSAVTHELRLMQSGDPQTRAQGPYSRNPDGPADAGTADEAPLAPSADMGNGGQTPEGNGGVPALNLAELEQDLRRTGQCPLCHGQVRALDRDGNPIAGADANGAVPSDTASMGQSDTSVPADGWDGRSVVAEMTREITRAFQPQYSALASTLSDLSARLARIEQTPQSGGPVLRAADRGSAFGAGGYAAAGKPTDSDRYAALESLAGRITDPQAQTAVAAEMIRMQQEAAGMPASYQVMPRAGAR